jgi:hypothetical protein
MNLHYSKYKQHYLNLRHNIPVCLIITHSLNSNTQQTNVYFFVTKV